MHHHIHKLPEPDTNNFFGKFLYNITIAAGIISPIMVLPQIYKIYSTHNATGVSALSWFSFALLDLPFIIYSLTKKDKPILITYSLFFFGNLAVAIGAIMYNRA